MEDLFTEQDSIDAQKLMLDLVNMDRIAKANGFSLVGLLVQAARDQQGVSIWPPTRDAAEIHDPGPGGDTVTGS